MNSFKKQFDLEISKITQQLISRYRPEKIILFGSAAFGKVNEGSDIDMIIIKKSNKKPHERIGEVLHLVDYSLNFDPHVFTPAEFAKELKLGEFFVTEAARKGKILYDKS